MSAGRAEGTDYKIEWRACIGRSALSSRHICAVSRLGKAKYNSPTRFNVMLSVTLSFEIFWGND